MVAQIAVVVLFLGLSFLQALFAYMDGAWHKFVRHPAMWTDLVLIPWMAWIIIPYYPQWPLWGWIVSFAAGMIVASGIHYGRLRKPGCRDHKINSMKRTTRSGHTHLIYQAFCAQLQILMYLVGEAGVRGEIYVAVIGVSHMIIGVIGTSRLRRGRFIRGPIIYTLICAGMLATAIFFSARAQGLL